MLWTAYKEGHSIGNCRWPQAYSLPKAKTYVLLLQGNEFCQQHTWTWRQIHPQLSPIVVKNPPANAGDIRDEGSTPGQEDPLEEGMPTHSSTLAWRIPWTEEPGGLQSMGSQRVSYNWSHLAHIYNVGWWTPWQGPKLQWRCACTPDVQKLWDN